MALLNTAQAAERLGLKRRGVLHRIKAGTLVAVKVGTGRTSGWVIEESEIERIIEESHDEENPPLRDRPE